MRLSAAIFFGKPYAPATLTATTVNDTNGTATAAAVAAAVAAETVQPAVHSWSDKLRWRWELEFRWACCSCLVWFLRHRLSGGGGET